MILMAAELGVKTVDRIVNGPKERRKEPGYLRNRRAFMGATALVACLGVVAGSENVTENTTVNHTIEAGEAVVQYIDRELSEQHVIGFTTKVDGTYAEQVVQRKGWFGIDLPDLVNGMTIDNYVVQSSLCFDG